MLQYNSDRTPDDMAVIETVGILCADITNSMTLGYTMTPESYGNFLRTFAKLASTCIRDYQDRSYLGDDLYMSGYSDNVLVVIKGEESKIHISRLAIALKQQWDKSPVRENLQRHSSFAGARPSELSMGIGYGTLVFDVNPWTDNITPEGKLIDAAKGIQLLAEEYAPESLMLATIDVKKAAERANLGLVFASSSLNLEDLAEQGKDVFIKYRRPTAYLFPVLSYPQVEAA